MNNSIQIYHNPRCSKSRQTLQLLEQHGIQPQIIDYLNTPPSPAQLTQIIQQLGITPRELLRKGEALYKQLALSDSSITDEQLIQLMSDHPKLIERPIVINHDKARIGRPPTTILDII